MPWVKKKFQLQFQKGYLNIEMPQVNNRFYINALGIWINYLRPNESRPLHDLMLLLFEALKAIVDERVIKFNSSGDKSGNGEVIYNINKGEYFVQVEYNHPETLIYKTYNRVTEKVIDNLELGRIEFYKDKNYKNYRWRNDVELTGDFINLNKQDQLDS